MVEVAVQFGLEPHDEMGAERFFAVVAEGEGEGYALFVVDCIEGGRGGLEVRPDGEEVGIVACPWSRGVVIVDLGLHCTGDKQGGKE